MNESQLQGFAAQNPPVPSPFIRRIKGLSYSTIFMICSKND